MSPRGRNFAVRLIVPLLAAGTLAVAAPAALADTGNSPTKAALATERYLSSYGDSVPSPADNAALATERYFSSYGNPDTLAPRVPAATKVAASSGPSWTSAILAGIALALAAGIAGIAGGRATRRPKLTA